MLIRTKNHTPNQSHLGLTTLVYRLSRGPSRAATLGQTADLSPQALLQPGEGAPNLENLNRNQTSQSLLRNRLLGSCAPFVKTFIIRGIGYQVGIVENEAPSEEFPYSRYLVLRVGHSFNLYRPVPNYIGVRVGCKERKLVIYGPSKEQVSNYARTIFGLRQPSIYTGRGIRFKGYPHRRKLGKKDIRKGKV